METYGKILLIAMPLFLALVLIEKWYGWRKGFDTVRMMDMFSSLSSGVTNVTKDVLGLSISVLAYPWMVEHWALLQIENTALVYFVAFIALDFAGYWTHRLAHEINFLWNGHLVHHSSEEFNLACALRQSISSFVKLFTIFLLPAALLGVPASVIAVVAPLHLFAQFWYHTRHIGKMGWLEKIIVTPSHHRVHHAINPEYLDKNHSQIFIIWDKLFGTFQEELSHVPPVYGITRPVATWNPIKINFQHIWLLIKDAWHTKSWKEKCTLWFKPTGYRPADVIAKYPVAKIENVYDFKKYDPKANPSLTFFMWFQLLSLLLIVAYFFGNIASIGSPAIFWYGLFIFTTVYAYTELMDRNKRAWIFEGLKIILAIGLLKTYNSWFFDDKTAWPWMSAFVIIYLIISGLGTLFFQWQQQKEDSIFETAGA